MGTSRILRGVAWLVVVGIALSAASPVLASYSYEKQSGGSALSVVEAQAAPLALPVQLLSHPVTGNEAVQASAMASQTLSSSQEITTTETLTMSLPLTANLPFTPTVPVTDGAPAQLLPNLGALKETFLAKDVTMLRPIVSSFGASAPTVMPEEPTEGADDQANWSRLAFQSSRDGNWEIYLSKGDGTGAIRLTNSNAFDGRPQLNRGADRIVFVSDRAGNTELYSIQSDGSNLRRLTNQAGVDAYASWSPDGTRIVFASNRTGGWEIYVMNADGSGQSRLTNDAMDDLMPAWSPDGSKLAWVRISGVDDYLWVMNADGSDPRWLAGPFRFLQHPVWSPNSQTIAFDCDVDGDYWNEIAEVSADGTSFHVVYDAIEDLVDQWMGDWSPDGSYLVTSRVEYVIQGNQLVIDRSYIERMTSHGSALSRLTTSGYDLAPSWRATDTLPPYAMLNPVPRYVRGTLYPQIPITWFGADFGPAGLDSYELQSIDLSSGHWTTLLETTDTSATIIMPFWRTYAFRVRARDRASNISAWDGDASQPVTPYVWSSPGQVTDVRDVPTVQTTIVATPAPVDSPTSGWDGQIEPHFSSRTTTTVSANRSGYGSWPATVFNTTEDQTHRWILRPMDDRIANGGFEQVSLSPWSVGGSALLTRIEGNAQSGNAAVEMGRFPLPPTTNVSPNTPGFSGLWGPPRIGGDASGNLYAIWNDESFGGTQSVVFSTTSANGDWTTPQGVPIAALNPDMVVSPDGTVHVVAAVATGNTTTMKYLFKRPNQPWSSLQNLSGQLAAPPSPDYISAPRIALDSQGGLHVVWSTAWNISLTEKPLGTSWTPTTLVSSQGRSPALVTSPDGTLHMTWQARGDPYATVVYSARRPGTGWIAPETIPIDTNQPASFIPAVAIDSQSIIHFLWFSDNEEVLYDTQRTPEGQWLPKEWLTTSPGRWLATVEACIGPDDRLHVAWSAADRNNIERWVYYMVRSPEGSWSRPVTLSGVSNEPARANGVTTHANSDGSADVIWYEGPWSSYQTDIMTRRVNLSIPHDSTLSQALTVPVDTHNPTLSFAYTLDLAPTSGATFEAVVNDIVVFSTTAAVANWTHGWADLEPWVGQSVTISFRTHSTATSGPSIVHLDEVAMGSWRTPVIDAIAPWPVTVGAATRVTITGDNFVPGATLLLGDLRLEQVAVLNEQTLQATIPAGVRPNLYLLQLRNPDGLQSAYPDMLRLGRSTYLPLVSVDP